MRTTPPARRTWTSGPLLLIYVCTIGTGFIYRGSLTFLPAHLEEHLGLSIFGWSPEAVAGAMSSLVLFAAVFGQIIGGTLSDRISLERAAVPVAASIVPMLALVGMSSGVFLLFAAAGFVLFNFAGQPIFNGLTADYAPVGAAGRAFGVQFFLSFGIGSFAASAAGVIADEAGTDAAFYALSVVAAILTALVTVVALGANRRRRALVAERAEAVAAGG